MKGFKIEKTRDNKKVFYSYSCVIADVKSCKSKKTDSRNVRENMIGKRVINQLSQFHIQGDENSFLQSVRFTMPNSKNSAQYEITYCVLGEKRTINNNDNKNTQNNNGILTFMNLFIYFFTFI